MKFISYILPILASISACLAGPLLPGPNTYLSSQYSDGIIRYFDIGECYPFKVNGALALWAIWLKSTTCYVYTDDKCAGELSLPVGVPIPAGVTLINAADWGQLVGNGANCYANQLPGIPIESLDEALRSNFFGAANLTLGV